MKRNKLGRKKRPASFWLTLVLLAAGSVIMIMPLVWMILSSFKTQNELLVMPPKFLPGSWNLKNFKQVFKEIPFLRYYINSLGTSTVNTIVGIFTSCLFGYVFAKYTFPCRNFLFAVMLACMMIPYDTLVTTVYKEMISIGWTNTYLVLTVPYFVSIFGVFLMRQFYADLPDDYLFSAEIDGCGQFRTFISVAVPLARPTMAALAIYTFMLSYNSYLWPLVSVNSNKLFTLSVGVAAFLDDRGSQMALMMAASSMMILPICVVFALAQKQFVEGMTVGGIKG